MEKTFAVYILASDSRRLYTGITGNLQNRMYRHKRGEGSEFAAKYNINRLVYYEDFQYARDAIAREKEIKSFFRIKKIELIEKHNPEWYDLADNWFTCDEHGRPV